MNNSAPRRAFSLIELLIVIAILAVLAAILFPVLSRAREQGNRAACLSNIRQLGMALTMYVQDNEGQFPRLVEIIPDEDYLLWIDQVMPYVSDSDSLFCPSSVPPPSLEAQHEKEIYQGYAINSILYNPSKPVVSEAAVAFPTVTVAFCEVSFQKERIGGFVYPTSIFKPDYGPLDEGRSYVGLPGALRHNGGSNYVFVDGHARWHKPEQVKNATKPNDGKTPSFAL